MQLMRASFAFILLAATVGTQAMTGAPDPDLGPLRTSTNIRLASAEPVGHRTGADAATPSKTAWLEPKSYALLFGGVGILVFMARRCRPL